LTLFEAEGFAEFPDQLATSALRGRILAGVSFDGHASLAACSPGLRGALDAEVVGKPLMELRFDVKRDR
jgi:hypothetical protein